MDNEKLEQKIKTIQVRAEEKHYDHMIGPICKWAAESSLIKQGFKMNYDHRYNKSQHCSVDKMDVFHNDELVYAYAYGTVTAYKPGDWEKKIPDLYEGAIRNRDNAERSSDRAIRDKERKKLREQAKRFGIK